MTKKEIRAKWVAMLRSGQYKQTKECLRDDGDTGQSAYCCLGVLCELAVKEKVIDPPTIDNSKEFPFRYGAFAEVEVLPLEVKEWAGLRTKDGAFIGEGSNGIGPLTDLNDHGSSFAEIADLIEQKAEFLFDDKSGQ